MEVGGGGEMVWLRSACAEGPLVEEAEEEPTLAGGERERGW